MQHLSDRRKHSMPHVTGIELDLVIPTLNEEGRIGATVTAISQMAVDSNLALRLLVVDNGCVDATTDAVGGSNVHVPVDVISCRIQGKGAAVRAGVSHSRAPFVGYCDADLSTPPSAVASGIDLLRSGWEVVIGSRRCAGASYSVRQTNLRRFGGFAFRKMASELCGPVTDTQCGFKLFHSHVAKGLFSSSTLNGFAFDVEILALAFRRRHRMIELPIEWSDDPESSFRPLIDGLQSFRELRQLRRAFGRRQPPSERR